MTCRGRGSPRLPGERGPGRTWDGPCRDAPGRRPWPPARAWARSTRLQKVSPATAAVSWPRGPRRQLSPEVTAGVLASRPGPADPGRHSRAETLIQFLHTLASHLRGTCHPRSRRGWWFGRFYVRWWPGPWRDRALGADGSRSCHSPFPTHHSLCLHLGIPTWTMGLTKPACEGQARNPGGRPGGRAGQRRGGPFRPRPSRRLGSSSAHPGRQRSLCMCVYLCPYSLPRTSLHCS